MVTTGIINAVTANLCAWLLEKVGDSVGNATVAVVSYPFSATPKGFEEMRAKLKPEDDIAFVRMVNTMLELDSISATDKEHIRNVLGIDKDAKLQPLVNPVLSAEDTERKDAIIKEGFYTKRLVG